MGRLFYYTGIIATALLMGALFWFSRNVLTDAVRVGDIQFNITFLIGLVAMTMIVAWRASRWLVHLFVPTMIVLFTYGLLFFVSSPGQRSIFIICASLLYYMVLLGIVRIRANPDDYTAKSFFSIVQIVTLFLYEALAYALYINFQIPLWVFIVVMGFFVYILTYTSLVAHVSYSSRLRLYSLIIAFVMMQIVWVANFWPFNYTTMAAVSVAMYYILWDMVHMYFIGGLSQRRTALNVVIVLIGVAGVLLSARWVL